MIISCDQLVEVYVHIDMARVWSMSSCLFEAYGALFNITLRRALPLTYETRVHRLTSSASSLEIHGKLTKAAWKLTSCL